MSCSNRTGLRFLLYFLYRTLYRITTALYYCPYPEVLKNFYSLLRNLFSQGFRNRLGKKWKLFPLFSPILPQGKMHREKDSTRPRRESFSLDIFPYLEKLKFTGIRWVCLTLNMIMIFFPMMFSRNKLQITNASFEKELVFILILESDQRTPSSSVLSVLSPFGCFFPSWKVLFWLAFLHVWSYLLAHSAAFLYLLYPSWVSTLSIQHIECLHFVPWCR